MMTKLWRAGALHASNLSASRMATVGLIGLLYVSLSACSEPYPDIANQTLAGAQVLNTPEGTYSNVAWLDSKHVVFIYASGPSPQLWDNRLIVFTLDTAEWRVLEMSKPAYCDWINYGNLQPLPNGELGLNYGCHYYRNRSTGQITSQYAWSSRLDTYRLLRTYPDNWVVGPYTYAPDMSELIQESPVGFGLANQLYRMKQDGSMVRLFADWTRVANPSWSPDGKTIAFAGTQTYPGKMSDRQTLPQTLELYSYPWDLYLMNADGGNVRLILQGMQAAVNGWLLDKDNIFLGSTYHGQRGIWSLNINTRAITRVWPDWDAYAPSPDMQHMIILKSTEVDGVRMTHPVMISTPLTTPSQR